MSPSTPHNIPIAEEDSILLVRQYCRNLARQVGFGLVDQTRITTVASELARNIFRYAGTGQVTISVVTGAANQKGLEMAFTDDGPGIADIDQAMTPGFSTSGGLGRGLSGSKRLMDEFEIKSSPGQGTCVVVRKWL